MTAFGQELSLRRSHPCCREPDACDQDGEHYPETRFHTFPACHLTPEEQPAENRDHDACLCDPKTKLNRDSRVALDTGIDEAGGQTEIPQRPAEPAHAVLADLRPEV